MKYAICLLMVATLGCSSVKKTLIPEFQPAAEIQDDFFLLSELPQPAGSIPVSVYSFRDQTGQYKPQANVSSFSTAVTQGAASILVQALDETDWFVPVEREGLQNMLTERKIIRAGIEDKSQEKKVLPPLTPAKIILEGGIISYDSNIRTGGLGAEYFGIGASELYREDIISVYLRAVDVRSGKVLVSVSSTKSVLSYEVRMGFFRFVSFRRLAEMEGGYSENEPMHISVRKAIGQALSSLIMKGIKRKLWMPKGSSEQLTRIKNEKAKVAMKKLIPPAEVEIPFASNSAELAEADQRKLKSIVKYLKYQPALYAELTGYADKKGDSEYNKQLSKLRAQTVRAFLHRQGVKPEQVKVSIAHLEKGTSDTAAQRKVKVKLKSHL